MKPKLRFDIQQLAEFMRNNTAHFGYECKEDESDTEAMRDLMKRDGYEWKMDMDAWRLYHTDVKSGLQMVLAQLPKRDIVFDKDDAKNYPEIPRLDPARKLIIQM